jgi:CheY-like chemotaxis protein
LPNPHSTLPTKPPIHVLLVEDNQADVDLTKIAMAEVNPGVQLHIARDGASAMDFLLAPDLPRPTIVLLDLNLPKLGGLEVLQQVKSLVKLRAIPAIILSMSDSYADVEASYANQANAFLRKPLGFEAFVSVLRSVNEFWLTVATLADGQRNLHQQQPFS